MNRQEFFLSFYPMKIIMWLTLFVGSSVLMNGYEMDFRTNLCSEGLVGYSILALVFLSMVMFGREFLHFARDLRALVYSEQICPGKANAGEKVNACV